MRLLAAVAGLFMSAASHDFLVSEELLEVSYLQEGGNSHYTNGNKSQDDDSKFNLVIGFL